MNNIKNILETEYLNRNNNFELTDEKPDPLMVAQRGKNYLDILTCALFSYGNAKQIVKFLNTLPFDLTDRAVSEQTIRNRLKNYKYRFQNTEDIIQWFSVLQKLRIKAKEAQDYTLLDISPKEDYLLNIFLKYYLRQKNVISGIYAIIEEIYSLTDYRSRGFSFLIGNTKTKSALKRWNMFFRWMVRNDNLDLGIWSEYINKSDLIIPLDTHTFNLGKKFGLITSTSYNLNAALELTEALKKFDKNDPVKYDFALYRLGQEKIF